MFRFAIDTVEHKSFVLERNDIFLLLEEPISKLIESVDVLSNIVKPSYYVGLARICNGEGKLHVAPKIADLDYMEMLTRILAHPYVSGHTSDLFKIDIASDPIACNEDADMITPLIVVEYLRILKKIVKRGLLKSFYRVESNRNSSIKGKIMITKSISTNHLKNKILHNWCSHDDFGIDNSTNRLLKHALNIVSSRCGSIVLRRLSLTTSLDYLKPEFRMVSNLKTGDDTVSEHKPNPFYTDYPEALRLARLIIRRLGYGSRSGFMKTFNVPPYWIDMSKLFELYVLAKLREAIPPEEIIFQAKGEHGFVDFLSQGSGREMIIDAKYKSCYARNQYDIDNIRQLSAYARDNGLLRQLNHGRGIFDKVLPCVIVYPDMQAHSDLNPLSLLSNPIIQFEKFYKIGLSLPIVSKKNSEF